MGNSERYPLHGGQLDPLAKRFGVPTSQLVDFSANINPSGPSPAVLNALRLGVEDIRTIADYPDLTSTDLRTSIAHYARVSPQNVVVANGFVPLLEAALSTLPIRRCLLPVPAFVEYRRTLERLGVEVMTQLVRAETSFQYDPVEILNKQVDAILLANPQNPSGVCHDPVFVRDVAEAAYKKNVYILLDEAFIDYVPGMSLVSSVDDLPNLIVFRSVTKFYGIPGLRVAYAVSNKSLASSMDAALPPWPITTLASRAVIAALGDGPYAIRSISDNLSRKEKLAAELKSLGLRVYISAANFLLFQVPPEIDPYLFWCLMISEHKLVMRACADYEGLSEGYFRVAVKTSSDNDRLANALAVCLSTLKQGTP
jgi:threonine-phosphate decarboxylase